MTRWPKRKKFTPARPVGYVTEAAIRGEKVPAKKW